MTTENLSPVKHPMLGEPEVQKLVRKCEHYGLSFKPEDRNGHLYVVVEGSQINMVRDGISRWCPNGQVQATGAPNSCAVVWEAGIFSQVKAAPPTKLDGTKPDSEVIGEMTKQQIDTLTMLRSVLKKLDADIEAAYPDTKLANEGLGKGKRDLVIRVLDRLHELSSQNVPQFMTYAGIRLARHLAPGSSDEEIEIPEPPHASARVR